MKDPFTPYKPQVAKPSFFSSVFKTRPQLEAEVKSLQAQVAALSAELKSINAGHSAPRVVVTPPPEAPTNVAPTNVRSILQAILAKHEGKSYGI